MYYTTVTNKNCVKILVPVAPPPNGVYYWTDPIPGHLKTRHELILLHRQPTRQAAPKGVKRTILNHKWRFGGSQEIVSQDLLDLYRDEVRHGALTDAEFGYLESRGYAVESKLYDLADTEPLAPTETNGRDLFSYLSFDGSHPEQYINEAEAQRENRRTYKSHVSRPNILDHIRGINILGPVRERNGYYRFISWDFDRHSYIDPQQFVAYILAIYTFLVKNLPDCAVVAQVNPKNGSTVIFCYFPHRRSYTEVEGLVRRLDTKANQEIPGYSTPEIYPVFGPGKVYLPFNPAKTTIGDMGIWPKFRTKKSKRHGTKLVYSLAGFPEYVRTARKADANTIKQAILAACQQPMPAKKNKKKRQSFGKNSRAGFAGMGVVPKFRGRFLRTMVDFFLGKIEPEADTIGKYLTPWARAIAFVEDCWDYDDLKERLQRCIDIIPDPTFSDRLSDNSGELERVLDYTITAVIKGNGYQPRPEESTAIFLNLKKFCDRIGFVPSDPSTWDVLDKPHGFEPALHLVWTPKLARFVREIAPVLHCTMTQAKDLLKLVFNWIEARNEMAYSICASLMNRAGIKAHNDKVAAFLTALKREGYIEKVKNYGHFQDADGTVRKHGNFYVNTSKVVFRQQMGKEAMNQQGTHTLYLLYLSFLSSDLCEYLLEHRRLVMEERFRRRVCDLYGHTWKVAA
jgi:hypothetical protein